MNTHMTDIKNLILAAVCAPFAFLQQVTQTPNVMDTVKGVGQGVGLTVILFCAGKTADFTWQYVQIRRKEKREERLNKIRAEMDSRPNPPKIDAPNLFD